MADEQVSPEMPEKRKPRIRKIETVRERAEKAQAKESAPRRGHRVRKVAGHAVRPFKAAHRIGQKEYYPIKVREKGRPGQILNRRRYFVPSYFRLAWKEVRQVVWPSMRETVKLTVAVFVFAIIFGLIVTATDFGIEKLFREILIK